MYTSASRKLYEKNLKTFFEKANILTHTNEQESFDESTRNKMQQASKSLQENYSLLGEYNNQWGNEGASNERSNIDVVLEKVLLLLEPMALKEQTFCVSFFQLSSSQRVKKQETVEALTETDEKGSKILDEETKQIMNEIFDMLESELLNYVTGLEKINQL